MAQHVIQNPVIREIYLNDPIVHWAFQIGSDYVGCLETAVIELALAKANLVHQLANEISRRSTREFVMDFSAITVPGHEAPAAPPPANGDRHGD